MEFLPIQAQTLTAESQLARVWEAIAQPLWEGLMEQLTRVTVAGQEVP